MDDRKALRQRLGFENYMVWRNSRGCGGGEKCWGKARKEAVSRASKRTRRSLKAVANVGNVRAPMGAI